MVSAIMDRIRASAAAQAGLFGTIYFVGAEFGHFFSFRIENQVLATFWPPSGLMLAMLVLSKYRSWPLLLLGALTANLASNVLCHGRTVPVSLEFFLGKWRTSLHRSMAAAPLCGFAVHAN